MASLKTDGSAERETSDTQECRKWRRYCVHTGEHAGNKTCSSRSAFLVQFTNGHMTNDGILTTITTTNPQEMTGEEIKTSVTTRDIHQLLLRHYAGLESQDVCLVMIYGC